MKAATLNSRFSVYTKQPCIGRRCHLGLSHLERSQCLASKIQRTDAAGDFKLKIIVTYQSKNARAPKSYAKSTLPVLYEWNDEAWMAAHLFTPRFRGYFKPTSETCCSEKQTNKQNDSFQNITAHGQCGWAPGIPAGGGQWGACSFHACEHKVHPPAHGSRSHFNFQV